MRGMQQWFQELAAHEQSLGAPARLVSELVPRLRMTASFSYVVSLI